MEQFIYKEAYQYLSDIVLNVTDDCNLQCRYCFVEQHPHYMTLETAKKAVDWTYENLQKKIQLKAVDSNHKNSLYFFGGEPMLCYKSIIVPLVEYCKEKYPNIFYFGMTTNGTLLDKESIDFFKENNFNLLLSIDGAPETQNYNRPCRDCKLSSSQMLEKNIPYLLENFPNITFRSTMYAPTIQHLFENYLYAEKLGFKYYEPIEDNRHEWTKEQKQTLQNEFSKIYLYRLNQISQGIKPMLVERISTWLLYTIQLFKADKEYFSIDNYKSVYRCGLGMMGGSIGYDGNIYGCQEQTSRDNKNIFLIGNIFDGGINPERHSKLLSFYYNNQIELKEKKLECADCQLCDICKVNVLVCPSITYDLYQTMNTMTDINCFLRQLYVKNSLLCIEILKQLNKEDLINDILNGEL